MIPKIIHYCWFGKGEMPKLAKQCITSWEKKLPEYEIMLWNEENFDINQSDFCRQAYELKKYAFVSDYARVSVLKKMGGIYLDIDIEIIKPLDEILQYNVVLGTDEKGYLTAFMAAKKESNYFNLLLNLYNEMKFSTNNIVLNDATNNNWMQEVLQSFGYVIENKNQILEDKIMVFKDDFFHAKSLISGKYNVTTNTFAIHHHTLTWISNKTKIIRFIRLKIIVPIIGVNKYLKVANKLK